jgi:hypothetical protein
MSNHLSKLTSANNSDTNRSVYGKAVTVDHMLLDKLVSSGVKSLSISRDRFFCCLENKLSQ